MIIEQIEMTDFDLVEVKNGSPHCRKHGAMNKISREQNGDGIWRCLSQHGYRAVREGNAMGKKYDDCVCRAGCMERRQQN